MEKIPQGRYTKEFQEEAARLVIENGMSAGKVSARFSLPKSTLENWVRSAKSGKFGDTGKNRRPLTEVEAELAKVKRELAITRMARDILKKRPRTLQKSRCTVRDDRVLADQISDSVSLPTSWVSASGYHAWRNRPPSRRALGEARLQVEIRAAHRRTRETYGSERLQEDLLAHGVNVGVHQIKRRAESWVCAVGRFESSKQRRTLGTLFRMRRAGPSIRGEVSWKDLVERHHAHIPTEEGWLYLAGHKDLCTR